MKGLILVLPWPPSLNHYKGVGRLVKTRSGKLFQMRVNTAKTDLYINDVKNCVLDQKIPSFGNNRLYVELWLHPPNKRILDIDNRAKVLLDAMQKAGVYDDDSQIDRLLIVRDTIIKPIGQVNVVISINEQE